MVKRLNESPSEKEGKFQKFRVHNPKIGGLNESPSEKEGKSPTSSRPNSNAIGLNESPSEKEGKFLNPRHALLVLRPQ